MIKSENNLITGGTEKLVKIFDLDQLKLKQLFAGHSKQINDICSVDNNLICSGSDDRCIKVWDIRSNKEINKLGPN